MTNEEAKFILSAYRPNGSDASDPAMAEALQQAARDPELEAWFRNERAFDSVISQKLSDVKVPVELKSTILVGHKMMAGTGRAGFPWSAFAKWAAIFIVLVGITSLVLFQRPSDGHLMAAYRSELVGLLAKKSSPLDYHGRSLSDVQGWLSKRELRSDFAVSDALSEQATMGCQILDWNGTQVTLVCFDTSDGQLAHLLVVDRDDLPGIVEPKELSLTVEKGWTTASWVTEDNVYLLAGKGDRPELRNYL